MAPIKIINHRFRQNLLTADGYMYKFDQACLEELQPFHDLKLCVLFLNLAHTFLY